MPIREGVSRDKEMKKIKTLFTRDFDKGGKITKEYAVELLESTVATEKINGTNVRLTVRNNTLIRLEKRRNPSKLQKAKGIENPWYVDADDYGPEDKWIYEAARDTDLSEIEDGEWSGEAVGPKVQGNPLKLEKHEVILFSHPEVRRKRLTFAVNPPLSFEELKEWLLKKKSLIGNNCFIEGVVWWLDSKPISKIKARDFS